MPGVGTGLSTSLANDRRSMTSAVSSGDRDTAVGGDRGIDHRLDQQCDAARCGRSTVTDTDTEAVGAGNVGVGQISIGAVHIGQHRAVLRRIEHVVADGIITGEEY